jgi:hypothetical protein
MPDALYLAGTAGFFALMLAYVRGCARLGGAQAPAAGDRRDGRA